MSILLFLLVFCSAASLDFCHANYVMAVSAGRALRAAMWSVLQWCSGIVGFMIAVRVTMWVLPAEAMGLAVGTLVSVKRAKILTT